MTHEMLSNTEKLAEKIVDWLSLQRYGQDAILHAAVVCDWAGRSRFIRALAAQLEEASTK